MFRLAIVITHPIQYHAPLYRHLAKDGRFELKVFYLSDRGVRPFYENFSKKVIQYDNPILGGYKHEFMKQGTPKGWWEKRTELISFHLPGRLLEFNPQAVYFHGYANPSILAAVLRCRGKGIPCLLRGENEDLSPRSLPHRAAREFYLKWILPLFDGFLYIGMHNKKFYVARDIPEQKLFFVPYSVDNQYFREGCSETELEKIRADVRTQRGLDHGTRIFIYTHKFRTTMNPLDAVRAFRDIAPADLSGAALIMCGDGDLRTDAEKIAQTAPGAKIRFTGYMSQSDLRKHLLASDVMINPAQEPWGCSVNEGLASGLAMICSDQVAGWPDMVTDGAQGNGSVYPCRDVREAGLSEDQIARMKEDSLRLSRKLSFSTCADGLEAAVKAVLSK
jgi:glycosyltransferase involved in cell wall biosynthesis